MPPQNKDPIHPYTVEESDLDLIPDEEHHHHLEERKLELNIKGTIENLRNLDYSKVIWRNVILFILLHIYTVYGMYLMLTSCMWKTIFFAYFLYYLSAMGITMGVHRLWSHRSYKAILPLRVFLAACQTLAFQNSIYDWARDHRVHHKFSESDADPHNAQRGFFFSHMGWLMYRKHPDVIQKGKTLDFSDLLQDPVVRFQKKFYVPLMVLACFVLPTFIPNYLWGESLVTALMVAGFVRYCIVLHITWMVNSLAHWLGSKPFDKNIYPAQNKFVAYLAMGEGWHNYHHVFPFDYRSAELGGFIHLNFTTFVINFCAKIGWVYDLRVATEGLSELRAKRTGDGSHLSIRKKKAL
ncbi:UNVERIFIED_CONTAM: hypothetical protein GTU68_043742 [Idotea baltica]|nr:hypothetical protein [Idotea baltica]